MASPIAIPQSTVRIVRTDGFLSDDFEAHLVRRKKLCERPKKRLAGGALLVIDEGLENGDIDKEPEADSLETIAA